MRFLANTISPTLVAVPGFALLAIHVALTLSVLAAFLERPFVTAAGVKRFGLCASLQANFVTTVVGLLCTPVAMAALMFPPILLLWWPLATWLSYRVELYWYRRRFSGSESIRPEPILWGNILSNVVFFLLMVFAQQPSGRRLAWLRSLEPELTIGTAFACGAAYMAAFVVPAIRRRDASEADAPIATPAPQV